MIERKQVKKYDLAGTASRGRNGDPTALMIHWTGGERGVDGVVGTLKQRGLSYHYLIEKNGDIYELVHPDRVAYHAGAANEWSIGVALVGRSANSFTEEQETSLLDLLVFLDRAYDMDIQANEITPEKSYQNVTRSSMINGVLGHYQVNRRKSDPGIDIMVRIKKAWPDYERQSFLDKLDNEDPDMIPREEVVQMLQGMINEIRRVQS